MRYDIYYLHGTEGFVPIRVRLISDVIPRTVTTVPPKAPMHRLPTTRSTIHVDLHGTTGSTTLETLE
jgi:hypothetical protein